MQYNDAANLEEGGPVVRVPKLQRLKERKVVPVPLRLNIAINNAVDRGFNRFFVR